MATSGLSTIGVLVGYATEQTAGTRPTTGYTQLTRINAIGGVNLEQEQIDASALEDSVTKYIAGRSDTGGGFPITVNWTNETKAQWTSLLTTYAALTGGKGMWLEIYHPSMTDAFFIKVIPPAKLPMPEYGQNALLTVEINMIIADYEGLATAVVPSGATS